MSKSHVISRTYLNIISVYLNSYLTKCLFEFKSYRKTKNGLLFI